jgi:3-oxoacyl-[acyl-carrier protein] reductase
MSPKVVVITGASSGIGAATARELARRGWRIAVNYARSAAAAQALAGECADAIAVQADVALDADCRRLAATVLERWGRIDLLVNNAGKTRFVKHDDLEGLSAEDFHDIFGLNVVAPFQMVRACAAALKEARGSVVNVSSVAALLGTGSSIAYAASKAALDTMTRSLARALAPEIRVNAVAPGHVRTPWHEQRGNKATVEEVERRYAAIAPLRSVSEPQDVAEAIAWLAEGARQVTGEILYIDGGLHIAAPR